MKAYCKKTGKKQIYFSLYLTFFLILIYAIQDFLTSANTGARDMARQGVHIALLILLAHLTIYYIYTISHIGIAKSFVKQILWLLAIWITVVNLIQSTNIWNAMVHLGLSVLWVLVYHFFSYYLYRFPDAWCYTQTCIIIMFGFYVFSALHSTYLLRMTYNRIVAVNLAYNVIVFLPWILSFHKKWIRILGIGITFLTVLISMKRGAIIVLPVMLCVSLLVDAAIKKKRISNLIKIILIIMGFFVAFYATDQLTGGYLSRRFALESFMDGSGRALLYQNAIKDISERSMRDFFLGRGSGSSIWLLGTATHNDWLEFLFDFGIIGVIFYAALFITLFWKTIHLMRKRSPYASAYAMGVVYMLVVGMYGMIYFAHSTLYIIAFFGSIEGLTRANPLSV